MWLTNCIYVNSNFYTRSVGLVKPGGYLGGLRLGMVQVQSNHKGGLITDNEI